MKTSRSLWSSLFVGLIAVSPPLFKTYYLENTNSLKSLAEQARLADQLLLDFVVNQDKELLALGKPESFYVLRPKLIRAGNNLTIKIEKMNKEGEVISVSTAQTRQSKQLKAAIDKAMTEAMDIQKMK